MPNYKIGIDLEAEGNAAGALGETASAADMLGKALPGVIGFGAAAGGALLGVGVAAFGVASDVKSATNQIGASLGVSSKDAKAYGEVIKQVYGNNFGGSIADVGTAVEQVAKQLQLAADDPALATMTENAFALRDVFEVDVNDSVNAAKTLMENFGLSGEEAFDHIAKGYQLGLDSSGDFLDTIGEYSTQFKEGGASASEFFSFLETGLQGGMLGTDKAADLFKEFRVRIMEGSGEVASWLDAMEGVVDSGIITQIRDGGMSVSEAFSLVQQGLRSIEDPIERHKAGIQLMGTQWEDLGEAAVLSIDSMSDNFHDIGDVTDTLNQKYGDLGSVAEGMWRKFQVGIAPAGEAILGFVNDNLPEIESFVGAASDKIVEFVNKIPGAIEGIQTGWDEDWGGMRTTVDNFVLAVPIALEGMWTEIDLMFQREGDETGQGWENFWGEMSSFFTSWTLVVIDSWTMAIRSIRVLWDAWADAFGGDWEGFWSGLGEFYELTMNQILNWVEFTFGPELRNKIVGALTWAWDGMKAMWEQISAWWGESFGGLFGGGVTLPQIPVIPPEPQIIAPGGQASAYGTSGNENHINVYVERGDFEVVREATRLGLRQAQQMRGE